MWTGTIRLEQQSVDKMYFDLLDRWGWRPPKYEDNPDDYWELRIEIYIDEEAQAMVVRLYRREDPVKTWEEWAEYMDKVLQPKFDPVVYP